MISQNKQGKLSKTVWTDEEEVEIAKKYAFMLTIQRLYGEQIDIATTLKGWRFVLSDYTADQILDAMDIWVKEKPTMPTPSDIIKTIEKNKPSPEFRGAFG